MNLNIVKQLLNLPHEALTQLQYLQPQSGCFNRCTFCSQNANQDIFQITEKGLSDLFESLEEVATKKHIEIASKRIHKPKVLFPYLDNDIFSYSYLDKFIDFSYRYLNSKVRLTTVGFSSKNNQLLNIHKEIVSNHSNHISGLRLSFTPYAIGYQIGNIEQNKNYINDVVKTLLTYKPLLKTLGIGKDLFCIEIRFPPLFETFDCDVVNTIINGNHYISIGPYMLKSCEQNITLVETEIINIINGSSEYNNLPINYFLYISDSFRDKNIEDILDIANEKKSYDVVELYKFANQDGDYFAINPTFSLEHQFSAFQIYPKTKSRKKSGYINATRFFLNTMIEMKKKYSESSFESLSIQSCFEEQIKLLTNMSECNVNSNALLSQHIKFKIIPFLQDLFTIYKKANIEDLFFNPKFTIDTGIIVNQGRAKKIFGGLTSFENDPLSPHEERGYGKVSLSSQRGRVWRIAPLNQNSIIIQELDTRHLLPFDKATGLKLREYTLTGIEIEKIRLVESKNKYLYPGN